MKAASRNRGEAEAADFVDAYISAFVPEEYVKTGYSLVSMLKELERRRGAGLAADADNLRLFSEAAAQGEQRSHPAAEDTSQARGAS